MAGKGSDWPTGREGPPGLWGVGRPSGGRRRPSCWIAGSSATRDCQHERGEIEWLRHDPRSIPLIPGIIRPRSPRIHRVLGARDQGHVVRPAKGAPDRASHRRFVVYHMSTRGRGARLAAESFSATAVAGPSG
jgi:hypothetical protein